jgi:hypothetical protein
MLPRDGRRVRWIKIEKKARRSGTSLGTVRKYLTKLERGRLVQRIIASQETPPGVYYQRTLDRYFQSVHTLIASLSPTSQKDLREWGAHHIESFEGFTEALTESLKQLHKIKDDSKIEDEQGRLFLLYGNFFLLFLSCVLVDYSDTGPSGEEKVYFQEILDVLIGPMLHGIAMIADPLFGRCKYSMEDARQVISENLPSQLKSYDALRQGLIERR